MLHLCHLQLLNKLYLLSKLFLEKMDQTGVFYFPSTTPVILSHVFSLFVLNFSFIVTGAIKLLQIRENSNFFRSELQKMGFEVLGDNDSPVMPIMLYNPAKIPSFSRECLENNVIIKKIPSYCFKYYLYILALLNIYLFIYIEFASQNL